MIKIKRKINKVKINKQDLKKIYNIKKNIKITHLLGLPEDMPHPGMCFSLLGDEMLQLHQLRVLDAPKVLLFSSLYAACKTVHSNFFQFNILTIF